ncbi:MAG: MaoC family dehydratase [Candidatus Lokiarchaeota archaeon]
MKKVTVSDFKVGQIQTTEFDQITRDLLKQYAKASGDTNPIHTSDEIAEKAGLNGVIAHGLFSFGFITKFFEELLNYEEYGKLIECGVEMRGIVRCGDTLVTKTTVTKIDGQKVFFDIEQRTITPIYIQDDDGNIIKEFEAAKRGYISDKDKERDLIHTKQIQEGTLTYRDRLACPGNAIIELNE